MPYTSLVDILQARKRIAPYVRRTPLVHSHWLSDLAGAHVSLKLETAQVSNSFKARGAFNAVLARLERSRSAPAQLVKASAGNHGRGLAAAAHAFKIPLVVFTPADAPQAKLAAIRRHGAELRAIGRDYDDAEKLAKAFAKDSGAEFISPYSDADVIAGGGTIALELFEDAATLNTVIVPIGGGGLISGVAAAAKAIAACEVIGVELEVSCPFQTSVRVGHLVEIKPGPTLADGLGGNPDPETITFEPIQRLVDRIVTVSEASLAAAVVGLVEAEHVIAEGAGAAATAAIVGRHADVRGRNVAAIVTGANIDRARLAGIINGV